jgi:hypothetical protein
VHVTLYASELGVAISQACYATSENHERAVLKTLLGQPLYCQIQRQFERKRQIPFLAVDQEISHGRGITWTLRAKEEPEHIRQEWFDTSWIVEVVTTGMCDSKPFNAKHLFLTSFRTASEGLLHLARNRWSIEGWHWIRDTRLNVDAHRYRGNGAGVMGRLRTAAL